MRHFTAKSTSQAQEMIMHVGYEQEVDENMDEVTFLSPQPAKWWHLEFRLLLPPSDWALQSLK